MATKLIEYATAQHARLAAAKTAAQQALVAAHTTYAQAQQDFAEANAKLVSLEAEVAAIRAQLAAIETPADGEPLLAQLSEKIIALRAAQSSFIGVEETLRAREAEVDRANAASGLAATNLKSAEATLAEATQQETRRHELRLKLDEPSLKGNKDAALAAFDNDPYKAAKARVIADLPDPLLTRASDRRRLEALHLAQRRQAAREAEDKIGEELSTHGGVTGKAEKARLDFERAVENLRQYIVRSNDRYAQALTLLSAVADTKKEPLTTAQIALINDPALKVKRDEAALLEQERDLKLGVVRVRQAELDQALIKARAEDVDTDPEAAPDVKTKRAALKLAANELEDAETDYTTEMRTIMDHWEAAVPDAAWRRFDAFEEAHRTLTSLKDADTALLRNEESGKESALVTALADAAKSTRTLSALETERARRATRYEFENDAAQRLLFSALRGDR